MTAATRYLSLYTDSNLIGIKVHCSIIAIVRDLLPYANEGLHGEMCLSSCGNRADSNQTAQSRSLIRVFPVFIKNA